MLRKKLTAQTASNAEARFTPRSATSKGTYHEQAPFKNFEGLAAKLLKVPKEEVDEQRAERDKKQAE